MKRIVMLTAFTACFLGCTTSKSFEQNPSVLSIYVVSDVPGEQMQIRVEDFHIKEIKQYDSTKETPFYVEMDSRETALTLRLMEGSGTFTAKSMRKRDGQWVEDGIIGIGKVMRFTMGEDSGGVHILD